MRLWSETIFKGTFFSQTNLNVKQILNFDNFYLRECFSYKLVASELKLSEPTINDWASFCREVLIEWSIRSGERVALSRLTRANLGSLNTTLGGLSKASGYLVAFVAKPGDPLWCQLKIAPKTHYWPSSRKKFCPEQLSFQIAGGLMLVCQMKDSDI